MQEKISENFMAMFFWGCSANGEASFDVGAGIYGGSVAGKVGWGRKFDMRGLCRRAPASLAVLPPCGVFGDVAIRIEFGDSDQVVLSWGGGAPNQISLPGTRISWGRPNSPQNCWIVRISTQFGILLLFSAILPSLWLLRKRGGNATAGVRYCHCGYDLRATPDRCPECGTVVLKMT